MRDEWSGFGEGRGLGGGLVVGEGLRGGLEGDGGLYLPLMAVGMKGGGGSPSVEVQEAVEEQGELGLAVHGGVVGVEGISHPRGFILIYEYFDLFSWALVCQSISRQINQSSISQEVSR